MRMFVLIYERLNLTVNKVREDPQKRKGINEHE
jgi:hypothetical protein